MLFIGKVLLCVFVSVWVINGILYGFYMCMRITYKLRKAIYKLDLLYNKDKNGK